jgi:hypothetical protein
MPCCNNSEKGSLKFWKNKREHGKMCESGKLYMKNKVPILIWINGFFVL